VTKLSLNTNEETKFEDVVGTINTSSLLDKNKAEADKLKELAE
jgi:hypothetical protein